MYFIGNTEIKQNGVSDHATILIHIDLDLSKTPGSQWRINTAYYWLPEEKNRLVSMLDTYLAENEGSGPHISTIWEAAKASVRGEIMRDTAIRKRQAAKRYQQLEVDVDTLMKKHNKSHSATDLHTLLKARWSSIAYTPLRQKKPFSDSSNATLNKEKRRDVFWHYY